MTDELKYSVAIELEEATGFIYANMGFYPFKGRKNFKILETHNFPDQISAVRYMLKERKDCYMYNIQLDKNYLPPSKRPKPDKVKKRRKRSP